MKAIQRIYQYIDFIGVKAIPFEKKTGLSNGYLGKQLARSADLGEGILIKIIENCPEISPEWLLTGKGEMLKEEAVVAPVIQEQGGNYKELAEARLETIDSLKRENQMLREDNTRLQEIINGVTPTKRQAG